MNKSRLFGICIGVLIALTLVNAMTLDQLLDSYDNSYNSGLFTADLTGFRNTTAGAGKNIFNFTIGGTGASSLYTAIATLNIENSPVKDNVNVIQNQSLPGTYSFTFDGNQFVCNQTDLAVWSTPYVTYDVELKIYKSNNLEYQNTFRKSTICNALPAHFYPSDSHQVMKGIDTNANSKFEYLNISLYMAFAETKTYKLGLYVWDNRSATSYLEGTVNGVSGLQVVSLLFNASQFRDFDLKNNKILLKSITIDGHIRPYGIDINGFNIYHSKRFNLSNFDISDVLITNVSFDKLMSGNKIKELGVKVNVINPGAYRIESSLENQFGEIIRITNKTTSFAGDTETLWFNGTEMYNSKISGPYRVGFLRITKLGSDIAYKVDAATSSDMQYLNFTPPPMPDLKINNSDLTGSINDVNITVHNIGNGDAAGVTISLFDENSNKVKEIIVSSINSSTNYFYSFKNVNLTHAFVFVDFNNLVEETNESNNIAEFQLTGVIIQPARIISKQPVQNSLTMTDSQSKQFNVTVNGTLPINYKWYINNGSLFRLVSTSNNFTFAPNYYDEGIRTLRINVTNSNGSDQKSWNINVTPNKIAVYAYVYNKNQKLLGNTTAINSDISFDGTVKSATTGTPAKINLTVDKVHNVTYFSTGFKNFTTKFYFDKNLFTCKESQNCVLTNTNCVWDSTNNDNWACIVTNGATTDYFRMYTGPKRIKINAYLAANST